MISHTTCRLFGRELLKKDRLEASEKYNLLEDYLFSKFNWPDSFFNDGMTCCEYVERYISGRLTPAQKKYLSHNDKELAVEKYRCIFLDEEEI